VTYPEGSKRAIVSQILSKNTVTWLFLYKFTDLVYPIPDLASANLSEV